MALERLQTAWHAAHQPSWPYTIALQHQPNHRRHVHIETSTEVRTYAISCWHQACTHHTPIAEQSGAAMERVYTAWRAAYQPSWPYTVARQHHPTSDDTCIETSTEERTYAISCWHHALHP